MNFIDGLPRNSAFVEAVSQDDALATVLIDRPQPEDASDSPRIAEYSPEVERLDTLIDRVGELLHAFVAANGGKPGRLDAMPRPITALHRARRRKREAAHRSIVARMLPKNPT